VTGKIKGVVKMTMAIINGASALGSSPVSARQITPHKTDGGRKTVDDVLDSLRKMMPGWTISTSTADWGEGFRNIQIDRDILQEMADNPKAMEKYSALIRGFEDTVPALEKWGKENPGQSVEIGFSFDEKGNVSALAVIKTLMGIEKRTAFNLPSDKSSWAEIICAKLDALNKGQVEDINGAKSWVA